jgi:ABC-type phosphate transport system substrate-binding protein/MinD-like ATPase involved in chromosome partitioning or flagellar assembly
MESGLGEIITFYSYKGGTGRSMALANVACLLAQKQEAGNDVLMIDWDLEAPGLHQFFHGRFENSHDKHGDLPPGQLGLIDLFYEIRTRLEKGKSQDNIPEDVFAEIDIQKYIVKTNQPSLLLMPAGKFDDGLYSTRVNEFDWSDFFSNFPLAITQFAQYLHQNFRYVLIDSRTGYTDTSGICTSIMPEKLVTVFTPNRQSVSGVVELIRRAIDYRKQSDDLRPLMIFPLPSRIENAESNLKKEWRDGNSDQGFEGYQKRLENVLIEVYGLQGCDLTEYFDKYQLQYVPRYSYGEEIAVISERTGDRLSLAYSFENFTEKLVNNENPWGANVNFQYGYGTKTLFAEPWIKSRKLLSDFRKNSYVLWASGLLLLLILWGMFSFLPARQTPFPAVTSTYTPTALPTVTATLTVTTAPTPLSVIPVPAFMLSDQCKLPIEDSQDHDYLVPGHLLLADVYKKQFFNEPDSNDLYAIAYYNNRKILEGYNFYSVIDPVSLDVRRDWKIFIPPQKWIDDYKEFPATIPQPVQIEMPSNLHISGSSILSHLSAQISKCSAETTGIELIQSDSNNTVSGLQDLCQSKVDLFGANKEIDSKSSCAELEKFEVARYAMVIFINKNNPNADDVQNNPFTNKELAKFLTISRSWKEVRGYWSNNKSIARYYPSLESGEFEVVKNGIFPDMVISPDDIPGLNIYDDEQSLLDKVAEDANAVGIVDYDSYQDYQNKNLLIAIPVNGVYASSAIIENNSTYPLIATLYLYTGKRAYETNKSLHSFINYYLSYELDFLDDLGYLYPSKKGYMGNPDTIP